MREREGDQASEGEREGVREKEGEKVSERGNAKRKGERVQTRRS